MDLSPSLDERLIKAFAHPLRWRLLELLTERGEGSPIELARLLDQPLHTVSHHVRVLRESGCIELTRTEQRRGAVEHFYRPLLPAFVDAKQWPRLPAALRRAIAGQVLAQIVEEAAAAGEAGAFDAPEAHVDRLFVELDEPGRRELSDLLIDVLQRAQEIQERSDERREGEVRMSEIALLHFEAADRIRDDTRPKRSPPVAPPS